MYKFILYLAVLLALTSCGGKDVKPSSQNEPESSLNLDDLPAWFTENKSSDSRLYGVGIAYDTTRAVDHALIDLISNITLNVGATKQQSILRVKGRGELHEIKSYESETILEVKNTFTPEYIIEKYENIDGEKVLLISCSKKSLISMLKLSIEDEKNALQVTQNNDLKNVNILRRLDKLNKELEQTQKVNYILSMLNTLENTSLKLLDTSKVEGRISAEKADIKLTFEAKVYQPNISKLYAKFNGAIKKEYELAEYKFDEQVLEIKPFATIKSSKKKSYISHMDVSDNGKHIVGVDSVNNSVYLWSVKQKKILRELKYNESIKDVQFTPNGHLVAFYDSEPIIRFWDWKKNSIVKTVEIEKYVGSLAFFKRSDKILVSNYYGVDLVDTKRSKMMKEFKTHHGISGISALAISNDERFAVFGGERLYYVDLKTAKVLHTLNLKLSRSDSGVHVIKFLPDDKSVIVGTTGGVFSFWNLVSGKAKTGRLLKDLSDISLSKDAAYAYLLGSERMKIINISNIRENFSKSDVSVDGKFYDGVIKNGLIVARGPSLGDLSLFNQNDQKIEDILLSKKQIANNELKFEFDNCSQSYRALQPSGLFGGLRGVEVYKGCTALSIKDSFNKEIYTTQIDGKTIHMEERSPKELDRAAGESFNDQKAQDGFNQVIEELKLHRYISLIMES